MGRERIAPPTLMVLGLVLNSLLDSLDIRIAIALAVGAHLCRRSRRVESADWSIVADDKKLQFDATVSARVVRWFERKRV